MAKDKKKENETQVEVEQKQAVEATPATGVEDLEKKYNLKHIGRGRYKIGDEPTIYESKGEALKVIAAEELKLTLDDDISDIQPEDLDVRVLSDALDDRQNIMELPMNLPYLSDGSRNAYYDREFAWGWCSQHRAMISNWERRGYRRVTMKELKEAHRDGRVPDYVLSLVYEDGTNVVYHDAVLMRVPRYLRTARMAQKEARARKIANQLDNEFSKQLADTLDNAGVPGHILDNQIGFEY